MKFVLKWENKTEKMFESSRASIKYSMMKNSIRVRLWTPAFLWEEVLEDSCFQTPSNIYYDTEIHDHQQNKVQELQTYWPKNARWPTFHPNKRHHIHPWILLLSVFCCFFFICQNIWPLEISRNLTFNPKLLLMITRKQWLSAGQVQKCCLSGSYVTDSRISLTHQWPRTLVPRGII